MIPYNRPPYTGNEDQYVLQAMRSDKISGDGYFSRKCENWFERELGCNRALLTPSCTHALELAALLLDLKLGDEVIVPSYTFVSTANAFALRGAKIVFIDIRPDTLNIDENLIEAAITSRTKAIVPVHYAGVACEMDAIMNIAEKYSLFVIEDAAQAITSSYKGRKLGTIGHMGAFSFHETKNITSGGEGGLLIVNDENFKVAAEVAREKGTNRAQFFRGEVDKYTWVNLGSSCLPSEIQAAYLWGQLEKIENIINCRKKLWSRYIEALMPMSRAGHFFLPSIPCDCEQNGHIFYIKVKDLEVRSKLIKCLREAKIHAVFHYVPLHSSKAGKRFGVLSGADTYTTRESERIIRLPLFYGLSRGDQNRIIEVLVSFFRK